MGTRLRRQLSPDDSRVHARTYPPCRLRHSIVTPNSVCTGSNGSRIGAGFSQFSPAERDNYLCFLQPQIWERTTSGIVIWGYRPGHLSFPNELYILSQFVTYLEVAVRMRTWKEGLLYRDPSGDTDIGTRLLQTVRHVRIGGRRKIADRDPRGTVTTRLRLASIVNHGKSNILSLPSPPRTL